MTVAMRIKLIMNIIILQIYQKTTRTEMERIRKNSQNQKKIYFSACLKTLIISYLPRQKYVYGIRHYAWWIEVTHWGRDNIPQTYSNVFSSMKVFELRLTFHWNLFIGVKYSKGRVVEIVAFMFDQGCLSLQLWYVQSQNDHKRRREWPRTQSSLPVRFDYISEQCLNFSRTNDVYMRQLIVPSLVSIMVCRLCYTKLSSQILLVYY